MMLVERCPYEQNQFTASMMTFYFGTMHNCFADFISYPLALSPLLRLPYTNYIVEPGKSQFNTIFTLIYHNIIKDSVESYNELVSSKRCLHCFNESLSSLKIELKCSQLNKVFCIMGKPFVDSLGPFNQDKTIVCVCVCVYDDLSSKHATLHWLAQ